MPTLHKMCIQVLQEHVESIEECGGLSYDVLEPVLERAQPDALARIEEYNPYLMQDSAPLWLRFCEKNFPKAERLELESGREMYERCVREREEKLLRLKAKVSDSVAREKSGQKKVKLAYVGLNAKPPRTVMRAQAKNGTALPMGHPLKRASLQPRPFNNGGPSAASAAAKKPRMAPMMAKTLKMARGMKGFRR